MRLLPTLLFLVACGKPSTVTPTNGSGGAPAKADCEPGRCLDDVSNVIADHRAEAQACYDEGKKRDKALPGKLVMNYEIDGDGTVVNAEQGTQDDQLQDPEVVACVTAIMLTLKFPKSVKSRSTRGYHRFSFD